MNRRELYFMKAPAKTLLTDAKLKMSNGLR